MQKSLTNDAQFETKTIKTHQESKTTYFILIGRLYDFFKRKKERRYKKKCKNEVIKLKFLSGAIICHHLSQYRRKQ